MDLSGDLRGLRRVWPLALLACVVACTSPATATRDTPAAGEEPAPRFAAGGPDAPALGAGEGYPKGDRSTFYNIETAVGSHSHLDEIFPGPAHSQGADALAPRAGRRACASPGGSRTPT